MIDGDHGTVNHHAHEAHGAGRRRGDRDAVVRCPKVHATVPAHPRLVRRVEGAQHRRFGGERPIPGRRSGAAARTWPTCAGRRTAAAGPAAEGRRRAREAGLAFICPAFRAASAAAGVPALRHVENARRGGGSCPVGSRARCSTLGGAVCCALNAYFVSRQHASFRNAGEQQLTTRIQPSNSEAPALFEEDCASCGQGPGPDEKSQWMPGARPALGHANQPSTIGRVRGPRGFLMNDLPEGASACPS